MTKRLLILVILLWVSMPAFALTIQTNPDSIPFAPAVNYGVDAGPQSVFCADLDGDGDLDLAVANTSWGSFTVSILKNNGDGTFQTAVNYGVGERPCGVFCADLDRDGDLDLAVANYFSGNVSILKNNGDGTFQTAVNYGAGSYPTSVFCADLDGDLDLDLAVTHRYSNNISILKNNGDGTFQTKIDFCAGNDPHSVFCADLDGDLNLDLVVANESSGNVSILKNNGDGTFQTAANYITGDGPLSVFCSDLDGDGDLDLAVANCGSDYVSVLKNNGDGTFQTAVNYGTGDYSWGVFSADLDGDGDLDIVVANANSDNVSILKNNGDGTFQSAVNYGAGDGPTSIFSADLDGDGDLDLAVADAHSDNVSILKNLTVRKPVELWVDIVGRDQIRFGQQEIYHISVSNCGYDDAYDVLLLVSLDPDVAYDINLVRPPIDTVSWDSVATSVQIEDTLKVIPIYLAKISPDSIYQFELNVTAPMDRNLKENFQTTEIKIAMRHLQTNQQACASAWKQLYQEVLHNNSIEISDQSRYDEIFAQKLSEYRLQAYARDVVDVMMEIGLTLCGVPGILSGPISMLNITASAYDWSKAASECEWRKQYFQTYVKNIHLVRSRDPNDKTGLTGFDTTSHYIPPKAISSYVIFFENDSSATADAENIVIMDTLDNNIDWSTLKIGPMSHPQPCSASFDAVNGILTWTCDRHNVAP